MASKRKTLSPPPRRAAADFAPTNIQPRSFFAEEHLRLKRDVNFALPHGKLSPSTKIPGAFDELAAYDTFPAGTSVHYIHDVMRITMHGSFSYHKCSIERDGITYYLYLDDDDIEVVTPV